MCVAACDFDNSFSFDIMVEIKVIYAFRFVCINISYLIRGLLVHGQVTIIFVVSVGLSVCLCRVFLSRL